MLPISVAARSRRAVRTLASRQFQHRSKDPSRWSRPARRAPSSPTRSARRACPRRLRLSRSHRVSCASCRPRGPDSAVMMLAGDGLKVVPVTIHLPLKDVLGALSQSAILETLMTTARWRCPLFRLGAAAHRRHRAKSACRRGRHHGARGDRHYYAGHRRGARQGPRRDGPPLRRHAVPRQAAREGYDVAVAMYHDQALIPLKTLAFDEGRQHHPRPSVRAHLARPRHGFRARRHRQSEPRAA